MAFDTQLLIVRKSGEPDDRLSSLFDALGIKYEIGTSLTGNEGCDIIPRHRFDERRKFLIPLVDLLQRHGIAINIQGDGRDWFGVNLNARQENYDAKITETIADASRIGFYKDLADIQRIESRKPEALRATTTSSGRVVA